MNTQALTSRICGTSLATLLALAATLPLSAFAEPVYWTGGNGNFTDSTWSPHAPGTEDGAIIGGNNTVTISADTALFDLLVDSRGTIEQTGGEVVLSNRLFVGGSSQGTYLLSGGSLSANNGIQLGYNNGGNATMVLSNNASVTQSEGLLKIGDGSAATTSPVQGALTLTGDSSWTINNNYNVLIGGGNASGTLAIGGNSTFTTGGDIVLGHNSSETVTPSGTINLSGNGTIAAKNFWRSDNSIAEFNADGGTIKAVGDHNNFFRNVDVNLEAGGVTFDTQGFDIVNITETSYTSKFTGTGGLTKKGTGTFTLNRDHDYSGATTVAEGTLIIAGSIDSTAIEVASGATLTLNNVDAVLTNAVTLILADGATLNLDFAGELLVNAISINGVDLAAGTYSAEDWGGLTGLASGTGSITVVPEPSTYAAFGAVGMLCILAFRRKKPLPNG